MSTSMGTLVMGTILHRPHLETFVIGSDIVDFDIINILSFCRSHIAWRVRYRRIETDGFSAKQQRFVTVVVIDIQFGQIVNWLN